MPVALVYSAQNTAPVIFNETTSPSLVMALNGLRDTPILETEDQARQWLLSQPAPSGWYADITRARAHIQQMFAPVNQLSGEGLRAARSALGLSRAQMARALGITGVTTYTAQVIAALENEQVDPASGTAAKLSAGATLRLRAMLADHDLAGVGQGR